MHSDSVTATGKKRRNEWRREEMKIKEGGRRRGKERRKRREGMNGWEMRKGERRYVKK